MRAQSAQPRSSLATSSSASTRGTDHEVLHDDFATERGYSSSRRDKTRRREPKHCRRPVARKGWAAGMPCSAAAARNWLRKGGVAQRLCAAPSSRPRSHVPTHCSFSHALGRPLHRGLPRRPSPSWSPLVGGRSAALLDWSCFGAQHLGKAATWCLGLLPADTAACGETESRPNNSETLAAAGVPQEVRPVVPAHPRQPTPRPLGQLLCDYHQSLSFVEFNQAATGDSLWVHSRPRTERRRHRRISPTVQ